MRLGQQPLGVLLETIQGKRQQVAAYVARGAFVTNAGIICAAMATALTAAPAIGGTSLTDALGAAGPSSPSWRILCGAAALFSLTATILTDMSRTNDLTSNLSHAKACAAKLERLEMDAKLKKATLEEALELYGQYIQDVWFLLPKRETRSWRFWRTPRLDGVEGTIETPRQGQVVDTTFTCSGFVAGWKPGLHLWLGVESGDSLWPKEGEISVRDDGSWSRTIFEQGNTELFSLSLWVVDAKGDRYIRRWFKKCIRIQDYPQMCKTPNMRRVTMNTNLHRVLAPKTGEPTQRPPAEPEARNA